VPEMLVGIFFNTNRNNLQAHEITIVALYPSEIQGIISSTGNGGTLLPNFPKDNTRIELERVEKDSYGIKV
jgi:hypothetical protein